METEYGNGKWKWKVFISAYTCSLHSLCIASFIATSKCLGMWLGCVQVVQLLVNSTVGSGALNFCYFCVSTSQSLLVLACACVNFISPQKRIALTWYKLDMSLRGNTCYILWEGQCSSLQCSVLKYGLWLGLWIGLCTLVYSFPSPVWLHALSRTHSRSYIYGIGNLPVTIYTA